MWLRHQKYCFDDFDDSFCLFLLVFVGVGISGPPPATATAQPSQQATTSQAAPQAAQTASMQPQATPQHHQLLMKHQQQGFLSPQSNQQVNNHPI